MTVQTYYVTASLLLGTAPPGLTNCVPASCTEDAVQLIKTGRTAVLPITGWDTARAVLDALGLPAADIEDRIHFATTARPGPLSAATEERQ